VANTFVISDDQQTAPSFQATGPRAFGGERGGGNYSSDIFVSFSFHSAAYIQIFFTEILFC